MDCDPGKTKQRSEWKGEVLFSWPMTKGATALLRQKANKSKISTGIEGKVLIWKMV